MENDSIRGSSGNTLVDIWIDGKLRGICVSRAAIENFLGLPPIEAAALSEEDRCEFVRTHLALVVTAATNRLRETSPVADTVYIDGTQLGRRDRSRAEDRRKHDRRKGERRKPEVAGDRPPGDRRQGDRRQRDRRKGDRRSSPKGLGDS
jgi:hypothetical protein